MEDLAFDGRRLDRCALAIGQSIEPGREECVDRRRDLDDEAIPITLEEEREDLFYEEGVPTRCLDDPVASRAVELPELP